MALLIENSGDPDQMPHSAASDLDLHCLPILRTKCVKIISVLAKSADPDQTPHSALCDLDLHCLLITILCVSRLNALRSLAYFFLYPGDSVTISPR